MNMAVFLRFLVHLFFQAGAFGTGSIANEGISLTLLILFEQLGDCGMLAVSLGCSDPLLLEVTGASTSKDISTSAATSARTSGTVKNRVVSYFAQFVMLLFASPQQQV